MGGVFGYLHRIILYNYYNISPLFKNEKKIMIYYSLYDEVIRHKSSLPFGYFYYIGDMITTKDSDNFSY